MLTATIFNQEVTVNILPQLYKLLPKNQLFFGLLLCRIPAVLCVDDVSLAHKSALLYSEKLQHSMLVDYVNKVFMLHLKRNNWASQHNLL